MFCKKVVASTIIAIASLNAWWVNSMNHQKFFNFVYIFPRKKLYHTVSESLCCMKISVLYANLVVYVLANLANWYAHTHNSTYDVSCVLPRWFFGLNLGL